MHDTGVERTVTRLEQQADLHEGVHIMNVTCPPSAHEIALFGLLAQHVSDNALLTCTPDMLEEDSCGAVEGGQRGVAEGLHTLL